MLENARKTNVVTKLLACTCIEAASIVNMALLCYSEGPLVQGLPWNPLEAV